MKKILLTILATTALLSCKKEDYTIEGEIKGFKGTDYAYIEVQNGMKPKSIDSVKIKDGKFSFKGKADSTDIAFIKIPAANNVFMPFFLENGSIVINIDKDSIFKSTVGGSSNNDDWQKFNDEVNKLQKTLMVFGNKNKKTYEDALAKKDQKTIDGLMKEGEKLQKAYMDFPKDYIKKNSNYVSLLMLENFASRMQLTPEEAKESFKKFNKEMQNSKSGKRITKSLNPIASMSPEQEATPEKKN